MACFLWKNFVWLPCFKGSYVETFGFMKEIHIIPISLKTRVIFDLLFICWSFLGRINIKLCFWWYSRKVYRLAFISQGRQVLHGQQRQALQFQRKRSKRRCTHLLMPYIKGKGGCFDICKARKRNLFLFSGCAQHKADRPRLSSHICKATKHTGIG